ncbi:MAG: TIGR03557 family F420-dependent LLM class oxidoreductase [Acidimicrobiia bacterium]
MTAWGYTLSSEEFDPAELVRLAGSAEEAGFSFASVSDHFHPWTERQGHSPFVWTTVGAVLARTATMRLGTGVTCPLIRVHPAIIAQAAASSAALGGDRFFLGIGTGEALNEHVTGERWPPIEQRSEMLAEAVAIMRELWTGETVDHHGQHYTVENARLFTLPERPPAVIAAASGPAAARFAAEHADGLWVTSPDAEVIDTYRKAGGSGPVYGQVTLCWGEDAAAARRLALEIWPTAGLPGQLNQDLPTFTHFEQAAKLVRPDDLAERVPAGPDAAPVVDLTAKYVAAGVDHLHFHQIGPDQAGFLRFWTSALRDALTERLGAEAGAAAGT